MTATSARALVLALPRFVGLVLVPVAVRAMLAAGDTLEQAHATLDALDALGVIELRPATREGLTVDAALCPVGPVPGTVYASLRVCEGSDDATHESAKEART